VVQQEALVYHLLPIVDQIFVRTKI